MQVRNLRKTYNRFALEIPSLRIERGEVVGLIGENGAGKSTFIKLLLGITRSDAGEVELFGEKALSTRLRERIGVAFDQCCFSGVLNLGEVEAIMRNLYPRSWDACRYFRLAEAFSLPSDKMIAEYSSGMRAKLSILSAICHVPDLLVLDEPTSSLDPVMRRDVNRIIRKFGEEGGKTVLFSSHIVNELEELADRILLMKGGRIVLDAEIRALRTGYYVATVPGEKAVGNVPGNVIAVLPEEGHLLYLLKGRTWRPEGTMQLVKGVSLDMLMYFYERGTLGNEGTSD